MSIEKAKALLVGETKCAIIKGENVFISEKKGVAPLMELLATGADYSGCFAADRVVGKAAALLYVKICAKEVYAEVISKAAIDVLTGHGIKLSYKTVAEFIRNRSGDGMCPMEMAVRDIDDPTLAVDALKKAIAAMRKG